MDLKGARVLVTGGSRRVGRAIVEAVAQRQAEVIIHCHSSAEHAHEMARALRSRGVMAEVIQADIAQLNEVDNLINQIGNVDVLVNNASVFPRTPLPELTGATWDTTLNTNLRGPAFLATRLGLQMKENGQGVIINITDCGVQRPYRNYFPYLVSKAGLEMATRALAVELAPEVRVVAIASGTVLPAENSGEELIKLLSAKPLLQKIGEPRNIAQAVLFAIENDFLTGTTITVDGGTSLR
ncbi:MAG: SDR family oxidoreductase [Candidatus Sumerlaeaceae bacterium]|nr:SDR family oxidoreductase [Candidatus Sumerlaeaceae bacterium]